MTPLTAEAIDQIKRSADELQIHADESTRLSRHIIGHEAASILAALRLLERELSPKPQTAEMAKQIHEAHQRFGQFGSGRRQ